MIEYRARPVTRWVITRHEDEGRQGSLTTICEVSSLSAAQGVGEALASREGASFVSYGPTDLGDIPLLLRRIAGQVEGGSLKADIGVLTLRAKGQSRPMVFGFGLSIKDPEGELDRAKAELIRLAGNPPGEKKHGHVS